MGKLFLPEKLGVSQKNKFSLEKLLANFCITVKNEYDDSLLRGPKGENLFSTIWETIANQFLSIYWWCDCSIK